MENRIVDFDKIKAENRPIVIWGAKNAGKICCRTLKKMNVAIDAIGDNDNTNVGNYLYDIPVLSLKEVQVLYPNALIVVGSFYRNVTEYIIKQLRMAGNNFAFCRFEQIEYLYELEFLGRKVQDQNKLFRIINNIVYDNGKRWKCEIEKGVMEEYRYVLQDDEAGDLKRHLSEIYGVKNLLLVADGRFSDRLEQLIGSLMEFDNIGHIIIVLDGYNPVKKKCLMRLASKVFYAVCDKGISQEVLDDICETGIVVETREIPAGLFKYRGGREQIKVTEDIIVRSMMAYVNNKAGHMKFPIVPDAKPVYIVQLFNGLANQTLMYLFGKFIEEESDRIVVFDDTILSLDINDEEENVRRIHRWTNRTDLQETRRGVAETRKRNGFYHFKRAEIAEVFDIPIRLLSDYFDGVVWNTYLDKIKTEHTYKYAQSFPLCHVLMENDINIAIVRDSLLPKEFLEVRNFWCTEPYVWGNPYEQYSITDFLLHNNENMYFMGAWSDGRVEDWLLRNRHWVMERLSFRLNLSEKNKMYAEKIKHSDGVMLHIRRGDFVYYKLSVSTDYFKMAIRLIEELTEYCNKEYFVFSDDPEWCMAHKRELGLEPISDKVTFVSGNRGVDSYMDMYLMSLGKIMVPTAESSFSYVSVLLSDSIEKCVNSQKYLYDVQHGLPTGLEIRAV